MQLSKWESKDDPTTITSDGQEENTRMTLKQLNNIWDCILIHFIMAKGLRSLGTVREWLGWGGTLNIIFHVLFLKNALSRWDIIGSVWCWTAYTSGPLSHVLMFCFCLWCKMGAAVVTRLLSDFDGKNKSPLRDRTSCPLHTICDIFHF